MTAYRCKCTGSVFLTKKGKSKLPAFYREKKNLCSVTQNKVTTVVEDKNGEQLTLQIITFVIIT